MPPKDGVSFLPPPVLISASAILPRGKGFVFFVPSPSWRDNIKTCAPLIKSRVIYGEQRRNSHRECVLSSRVLLNVLDSLYCVRAERHASRLKHTPTEFPTKRGCDDCSLACTEWGCWTKRVPRKQYALEFTLCRHCGRTKAAARAFLLFAFFGFTTELIFDRKLN